MINNYRSKYKIYSQENIHLVQLEDSRMSLNWNSVIKNKEHVWGPWAEPNVRHETQTLFSQLDGTIGSSSCIHKGQNENFYSKELRIVKKEKKIGSCEAWSLRPEREQSYFYSKIDF